MISSASGYEWVNVTNSSLAGFISGDILPARDIAADGSWRDLKYEDYLFILEAFLERSNWETQPSVTVAPAPRSLVASAIRGAVMINASWPDFINPEATLPSGIVSAASIDAAIGDRALTLQHPTFTDRSLAADALRQVFWNIKILTRTEMAIASTDIVTSSSYTSTQTLPNGSQASSGTGTVTGVGEIYSNTWAGSYFGCYYNAWSFSRTASIATWPHVNSATLLVLAETRDLTNSTPVVYRDVVPFACTVQNGVVSTPAIDFRGLAASLLGSHGLTYLSAPAYTETASADVKLLDFAVVADHVFPAEINSLNWNWQPA